MSFKTTWIGIGLVTAALAALFVPWGCGSSGSGGSDRTACRQARDCGPEGRSAWVCADSLCYSTDEYCSADSECNGTCVNHLCTGGKKVIPVDGDTDYESEADSESESESPCEYICCSDSDCYGGAYCDPATHDCAPLADCDSQYECCQDANCWQNASFGHDYACLYHKCYKPTAPACDTTSQDYSPQLCCGHECCKQADCPANHTCVQSDGSSLIGTCRDDSYHCTPNAKICCNQDPGNPDCIVMSDNDRSEAILQCNAEGNAVTVTTPCQHLYDCYPDAHDATAVTCDKSKRCDSDTDCSCPNKCIKSDGQAVGFCMLPTVGENQACAAKAPCGGSSSDVLQTAYCDPTVTNLICCVDQSSGAGTCKVGTPGSDGSVQCPSGRR